MSRDDWSESPFAGLVPSRIRTEAQLHATRRSTPREQGKLARSLQSTMPIVLVGSLALSTLGVGTAADSAPKRPQHDPASGTSDLTKAVRDAVQHMKTPTVRPARVAEPEAEVSTAAVVVPAHYTVRHGDTVSEIAGRYHLSTASILALNGLGWKSIIFPGQVLRLTKSAAAPASTIAKPSVVTPVTKPATASTAVKYTIRSGDTITAIAKKYGVSVAAVLKANGLSATSIIYAGRTLVIPAAATPATATTAPAGSSASGTAPAEVGSVIVPLSPEMKANALVIVAVGERLKVPAYGIIVALAAAAQESGLRDLGGGDKDSIGLFQQRPSTGWGTVAQLENTTYAAELFFGGPSNPNKGKTRGLLDVPGWQQMTLTQAAQAVEISGSPTAYAKWEASARAWYAALG